MKIYFAADHAGFELKNEMINFVRGEMNLDIEDCGAMRFDAADDYPVIIALAAQKLSADVALGKDSRALLFGASGQGEAIVANRFAHVRAAVFYGATGQQTDAVGRELDMITSVRMHNDANTLSLAARFITSDEAREAVHAWLVTPFSKEERHMRRIDEIDRLTL